MSSFFLASFFSRLILTMTFFSYMHQALGSTNLCGDLFPVNKGKVPSFQSKVADDFLKTSHEYFTATLTDASNSISASEKAAFFSKLSAIAKEHQLSHSEFQNWMEQAKLSYVQKHFIDPDPDKKLILLDHEKMQKLDQISIQMKIASMPDFLSSKDFISKIQAETQEKMSVNDMFLKNQIFNTPSKVSTLLKFIQDVPEFNLIQQAFQKDSIFGVVVTVFQNQDSNFAHFIFDYASETNERKYLWTLQRKIDLPFSSKGSDPEFKMIAYSYLPHASVDTLVRIFPFYSPELKTVSLALFKKNYTRGFSIEWQSLIPCHDTDEAMNLPHLLHAEQRFLERNFAKHFQKHIHSYEAFFYIEQNKSFLFFFGLASDVANSQIGTFSKLFLSTRLISAISDKDPESIQPNFLYDFDTYYDFRIYDSIKRPTNHYSIANDGSFVKLTIKSGIVDDSSNPPEIEGLTQQTQYIFFKNDFQIGLTKKERP